MITARRFVTVLAFFLASSIDIKVRATPIEVPHGCWQKDGQRQAQYPCAYLNGKIRKSQLLAAGDLRMSPDASLIRINSSSFRLIRGIFWFAAKKPLSLRTLYGDFTLSSGSGLLVVGDREIQAINLSGDLRYQARGEKTDHGLPQGMTVSLTRITADGVAQAGFPQPVVVDGLLKTWSRVYTHGELAEFRRQFLAFLPSWRSATKTIGPWYSHIVEREIASQKQEEKRQALLRAQRRVEINRIRDLFRRQNYIGADPAAN